MSSAAPPAPLLLDTHYWIWLQAGTRDRITSRVLKAIESAASAGQLLLSVISVWEVGVLEAKGRIKFRVPTDQWVAEALAMPGLTVAPLTPEIALDSSRLPGLLHADPADRIIVASARRLEARLVTDDRRLLKYGAEHHVAIL